MDVQLVDDIEPEYAPEMGDSFTLFIAGEIIGQFDDMVLPAFGNGLRWNAVYGANALSLQVVPLPAGIWLFVSAMGALRVLSRRQTG